MKWLSSLKLRWQIMAMFGAVAAIALIGGTYAANSAIDFTNSSDRIFTSNFQSLQLLTDLSTTFQQMRGDLMLMLLSRSQDEIAKYAKKSVERQADMEKAVDQIIKLGRRRPGGSGQGPPRRRKKSFKTYRERLSFFRIWDNSTRRKESSLASSTTCESRWKATSSRSLRTRNSPPMRRIADSRQVLALAVIATILGPVLGIIATIIMGFYVSRSITQPLQQLNQSIDNRI